MSTAPADGITLEDIQNWTRQEVGNSAYLSQVANTLDNYLKAVTGNESALVNNIRAMVNDAQAQSKATNSLSGHLDDYTRPMRDMVAALSTARDALNNLVGHVADVDKMVHSVTITDSVLGKVGAAEAGLLPVNDEAEGVAQARTYTDQLVQPFQDAANALNALAVPQWTSPPAGSADPRPPASPGAKRPPATAGGSPNTAPKSSGNPAGGANGGAQGGDAANSAGGAGNTSSAPAATVGDSANSGDGSNLGNTGDLGGSNPSDPGMGGVGDTGSGNQGSGDGSNQDPVTPPPLQLAGLPGNTPGNHMPPQSSLVSNPPTTSPPVNSSPVPPVNSSPISPVNLPSFPQANGGGTNQSGAGLTVPKTNMSTQSPSGTDIEAGGQAGTSQSTAKVPTVAGNPTSEPATSRGGMPYFPPMGGMGGMPGRSGGTVKPGAADSPGGPALGMGGNKSEYVGVPDELRGRSADKRAPSRRRRARKVGPTASGEVLDEHLWQVRSPD